MCHFYDESKKKKNKKENWLPHFTFLTETTEHNTLSELVTW